MLNKLGCFFMKKGKKVKTEKILKILLKEFYFKGYSPYKFLFIAFNKLRLFVRLNKQKAYGVQNIVPYFVPTKKQMSKGLKILCGTVKKTKPKKFSKALTIELLNTASSKSQSFFFIREQHKLGLKNKYLSKFRWF